MNMELTISRVSWFKDGVNITNLRNHKSQTTENKVALLHYMGYYMSAKFYE